jgi:hypothetical protein
MEICQNWLECQAKAGLSLWHTELNLYLIELKRAQQFANAVNLFGRATDITVLAYPSIDTTQLTTQDLSG